MPEIEQELDPEARWIVAKAVYAEECSLFQMIRRSIPKDKKRRTAAQIVRFEYAREQLSQAAKTLRDEEVLYRTSGATLPPPLQPLAEAEIRGKVPTKVSAHMGTFEEEVKKGIKIAQAGKPSSLSSAEQEELIRAQLLSEIEAAKKQEASPDETE